jgi:hypothetical protein
LWTLASALSRQDAAVVASHLASTQEVRVIEARCSEHPAKISSKIDSVEDLSVLAAPQTGRVRWLLSRRSSAFTFRNQH